MKRFPLTGGLLFLLCFGLPGRSVLSTRPAAAEEGGNGDADKTEYRYRFERIGGKLYRLDRKTGLVHRVLIGSDGIKRLYPVPVGRRPVSPGENYPRGTAQTGETPARENSGRQGPARPRKPSNHKPVIFLNGENKNSTENKNPAASATELGIPAIISDEDRKQAAPLVESYAPKIRLSHVVNEVGGRLQIIMLVSNLGPRRLSALEVTVHMPVGSGKRAVERRCLLVARPGHTLPPEPAAKGRPAPSVVVRLDLPAPPGGNRGMVSDRVTYLAFAPAAR